MKLENKMLKIAIAGINGRMGQSLYRAIQETDFDMTLSVATTLPTDETIGQSVGQVLGGKSDVLISNRLTDDFDVLIDFTAVRATLQHIDFCQKHKKSIVIGTTGFSEDELAIIKEKSLNTKIFMSANMSVGVNVMEQLVAMAAKALHQQSDIEIIEAHHKHKVDAPSGTALMLGRAIAEAIGVDLSEKAVYAREGITGEREDGAIGFSTIRGGDVVGEHTATYYMAGERVEISHKATDRQIFARGALFAANYLATQKAGLYNMSDALNLTEYLTE